MSDEMAFVYFWLGFCGGLALLCFVIWKVMDFISKRNDRKHHKEHPEFFRLYDDYDEKGNTACRFHNKEIAPLKRQVKAMLEEEPYWPQEVREKKLEELEEIRRKIYTGECMYKGLNKETEEARKKVADYVHTHNIKWAGDWN